ncbi:MAG: hypothetical protein ACKVZH_29530 [Blastocatellia bacterium]
MSNENTNKQSIIENLAAKAVNENTNNQSIIENLAAEAVNDLPISEYQEAQIQGGTLGGLKVDQLRWMY